MVMSKNCFRIKKKKKNIYDFLTQKLIFQLVTLILHSASKFKTRVQNKKQYNHCKHHSFIVSINELSNIGHPTPVSKSYWQIQRGSLKHPRVFIFYFLITIQEFLLPKYLQRSRGLCQVD